MHTLPIIILMVLHNRLNIFILSPLLVLLVCLAHHQYNILKGVMSMAERKGSSGRIPDSKRPMHKLFQKVNISIGPETFDRLEIYCAEQERARSWAIQKALDLWLTEQGY